MRVLATMACCLSMGCLVTDSVKVPESPEFPPSVVTESTATYPLDRIMIVNRDEVAGDLELEIIVRDANVDQDLEVQVYVDFSGDTNAFVPQDFGDGEDNVIVATGTVERSVTLRVPVEKLGALGCHQIELLVSSDFQNFPNFRQPVIPGDLHQSVWWAALIDQSDRDVEMTLCPQ